MKAEIEQVRINKPQITVYYRLDDEASLMEDQSASPIQDQSAVPHQEQSTSLIQNQPIAYLAGEALTLDGLTTVAESGEAVEYEVLLDISGSLTQERFADIRQSLVIFKQNLRPEDTFVLVTFGDEVTTVLQGGEDPATAQSIIEALEAHDQTTHLFDATRQIMERDVQGKRAVVVISDGKDYADNNVSAQAVTEEFAVRGIPVYTMAVENKEGDTETQIGQYRAAFSQMATSTGGLAWSVPLQDSMNVSVADFLAQLQESILGEYVAQFHSATNQVSMSREDLLLEVGSAASTDDSQSANVTAVRSVLVNTWQQDTVPPTVETIQANGGDYGKKNTIGVTYLEPVEGADICGNYELSLDGVNIPVGQVIVRDDTYTLVTSSPLAAGNYTLKIHGVTDCSQERNTLTQDTYTIEVLPEQLSIETEADSLALEALNEESETEEDWDMDWDEDSKTGSFQASNLASNLGSYLPYILAGLVLAGAVIALVVRGIKRKKNKTNQNAGYPSHKDGNARYHEKGSAEHVPSASYRNSYSNTSINPSINASINSSAAPTSLPSKNITILIEELGKDANHPRERRDVTVRGELYIGRSSQCQVQVRDPLLSKQHVQISVSVDGKLQVTDFDSTNGTSLNGVEVKGIRQLCSDDRITAGNHVFTVEWS